MSNFIYTLQALQSTTEDLRFREENPHLDDSYFTSEEEIPDLIWLAAVATLIEGDVLGGVKLVHQNQSPCLSARQQGFQPDEVAQFMVLKTQEHQPTSIG